MSCFLGINICNISIYLFACGHWSIGVSIRPSVSPFVSALVCQSFVIERLAINKLFKDQPLQNLALDIFWTSVPWGLIDSFSVPLPVKKTGTLRSDTRPIRLQLASRCLTSLQSIASATHFSITALCFKNPMKILTAPVNKEFVSEGNMGGGEQI